MDARVGFRSCDDEAANAKAGEDSFEARVFEGISIFFGNKWLGVESLQFADVAPSFAVFGHVVAGVLDPDDRHLLCSGFVNERCDVPDHGISRVGVFDNVVLHVDDQQGSVRPICQSGHSDPFERCLVSPCGGLG